jgi:hypothetical protein
VTPGLRAAARVRAVPEGLEISPVETAELERLLPVIAAYQRFYEVEEVDEDRNRAFRVEYELEL